MADYAPVLLPGLTGTFTAAGTITGGDTVEVAGSGTVQKTTVGPSAGLGSAKMIGVAAQDAISGARLTVIMDRVVHEGAADGAITAGDQVMSSSTAGRQVKTVPATSGSPGKADVDQARVVCGIALTSAADGATCRWQQRLPIPHDLARTPNGGGGFFHVPHEAGGACTPTAPGVSLHRVQKGDSRCLTSTRRLRPR